MIPLEDPDYGLGNEYMGVLIGSLLIGLMALWDRYQPSKAKCYSRGFSNYHFFIMSPDYGSNVGGTISALGAFAVTF